MAKRDKRFAKAYIEITNVCNLKCSFCKGTSRDKHFMSVSDFELYASKLCEYTDYVYLHVLGEPLLHPNLKEILKVCEKYRLKVCITTNGTLLQKQKQTLLQSHSLYKLCVSVHSFEANDNSTYFDEYISSCAKICFEASQNGVISVLRMWNMEKGEAKDESSLAFNQNAEQILHSVYGNTSWEYTPRGIKISDKLFLEYGEKFNWRENDNKENVRCYALRDQIGVLCDGTAIPCCIDCDGALALGNLKTQGVTEILDTPRAKNIYNGFMGGVAAEDYCKKCGFVRAKL